MSAFSIAQSIYRAFLPKSLRDKITKARYQRRGDSLKQKVIAFYANKKLSTEQQEVINYLKDNPYSVFPYDFTKNYRAEQVEVHYDQEKDLHYSLLDGKRLYIKRGTAIDYIKKKLNAAALEQDPKSPHLYLEGDFQIEEGDVLADIGVQEGNFALEVIEKVSKVYLFEADKDWSEALEATFAPWKDKVVIINKFVGDKNDEGFVTLDEYFKDIELNFLKIDVDGAERQLLKGAKKLLTQDKLKIALCTYHFQHDAEEFDALLKSNGFQTEFSKGYMLFHFDDKLRPPYLRRGLVRGWK